MKNLLIALIVSTSFNFAMANEDLSCKELVSKVKQLEFNTSYDTSDQDYLESFASILDVSGKSLQQNCFLQVQIYDLDYQTFCQRTLMHYLNYAQLGSGLLKNMSIEQDEEFNTRMASINSVLAKKCYF